MCQPVVTVNHLNYSYPDGRRALADVDFVVRENESVGLIGPNGAGKSTLLLHLAGLLPEPLPAAESAISIADLPVVAAQALEVRRKVGLLFQDPDDQLFCASVLADVAFGPRNLGQPLPQARQAALASMAVVGVQHLANRPPTRLSFGEKRLVCLAGILACGPSILALDEPTSNLDPRARRGFIDLVRTLPAAKLIASHDLDMVVELCTRVILLDNGSIAASGPALELLGNSELMSAHGLEVPYALRTWA